MSSGEKAECSNPHCQRGDGLEYYCKNPEEHRFCTGCDLRPCPICRPTPPQAADRGPADPFDELMDTAKKCGELGKKMAQAADLEAVADHFDALLMKAAKWYHNANDAWWCPDDPPPVDGHETTAAWLRSEFLAALQRVKQDCPRCGGPDVPLIHGKAELEAVKHKAANEALERAAKTADRMPEWVTDGNDYERGARATAQRIAAAIRALRSEGKG